MLSIKEILAVKPQFILAVNYDANLGDMMREDTGSEYLSEMTVQYHSIIDNACLAFTIECLISVNDDKVSIEEMNTSSDNQSVYAHNIDGLQAINGNHTFIYVDSIDEDIRDLLIDLIEKQPIYDAPNNFIIEAY